jgi:hypothetical protein
MLFVPERYNKSIRYLCRSGARTSLLKSSWYILLLLGRKYLRRKLFNFNERDGILISWEYHENVAK